MKSNHSYQIRAPVNIIFFDKEDFFLLLAHEELRVIEDKLCTTRNTVEDAVLRLECYLSSEQKELNSCSIDYL